MKVIAPYSIGATLINEFPASPEATWGAGSLYALGTRVQVGGTTNRVYESLISNNVNKPPATTPAAWFDLGPTNPYALLDSDYGNESKGTGEITVQFEADKNIDALGLMSMNATSVRVIITHDGIGQYDQLFIINGALELQPKFYNNFLDDDSSGKRIDFVIQDLPINPLTDVPCHVMLIFTGDNVAIGAVLTGKATTFGFVVLGSKVGIRDFSKKEVDDFGNYKIVKRRFSKFISASCVVEKADVDRMQNFFAQFRTTPMIWILDSDYQALLVYGYYREFEIEIAYPTQSICTLELEGLTGAASST
jgi:hypothetical protein